MKTASFLFVTLTLLTAGAARAQSMTASLRIGGSEEAKASETTAVLTAHSQTYLTGFTADKASGLFVTFLPKTTYVFETDARERYRKYLQAERLLLPTAGLFVEALRRDSAGVQGSTVGAGLSVRTVQALRGGTSRADLALYSGAALGVWRTEAEGRSASRLGARVFVGAETKKGLVLELAYSDRPSVRGFAPRGVSLGVGGRF